MKRLKKALMPHFNESIRAILPVVLIIVALCFTIAPVPNSAFLSFLVGTALVIAGMCLFNLGAETAMLPIGERIGVYITKSRKLWLVISVSLFMGILVTISEPDLHVLANQLPGIPNLILLLSVAIGAGLFLVVSLLRTLFSLPIAPLLTVLYLLVFVLACFAPDSFLAVAFDAGGVTTGPITVPFIMALGLGAASIRSDKHSGNDSFGLLALASIGPILAVLILGMFYPGDIGSYVPPVLPSAPDSRGIWMDFISLDSGFLLYVKDVTIALGPIVLSFLLLNVIGLRLGQRALLRILAGLVFTFFGLILFLTGVNVGFMPAGHYLGVLLASMDNNWLIIPIAMLLGYFIVSAEPAVLVLNKQVEEITSGAIPARAMKIGLSIGMCISVGLSMVRLLTGVHLLWFLLPGYAIALILAFFVPKIFTAIAFDSGGVAAGTTSAAFLLPFAIGACTALGGDITKDAFGIVAMVATAPLITIQIMGFIYKFRQKKDAVSAMTETPAITEDIID